MEWRPRVLLVSLSGEGEVRRGGVHRGGEGERESLLRELVVHKAESGSGRRTTNGRKGARRSSAAALVSSPAQTRRPRSIFRERSRQVAPRPKAIWFTRANEGSRLGRLPLPAGVSSGSCSGAVSARVLARTGLFSVRCSYRTVALMHQEGSRSLLIGLCSSVRCTRQA